MNRFWRVLGWLGAAAVFGFLFLACELGFACYHGGDRGPYEWSWWPVLIVGLIVVGCWALAVRRDSNNLD